MTSSWSQGKSGEEKSARKHKCKSYAGLSRVKPVSEHSEEDEEEEEDDQQEPSSMLIQPKAKRRSNKRTNAVSAAEFSSILFNSSEIHQRTSTKNAKSVEITHHHLRHRSSTFKAIDTLVKQETASKRNSALVRFGLKLKDISTEKIFRNTRKGDTEATNKLFPDRQKEASRYSRLYKSFSLFSYHQAENRAPKSQTKSEKKKFSSEPCKLSANYYACNAKQRNQSNYLKNLSAFEQQIELESLNQLVKKLENVSNLSVLIKNLQRTQNRRSIEESKSFQDAAVQTSTMLESASSSFNSHGTTMQTNCYGSIVANFGSAMIQRSQTDYHAGKKNFLRSHSDGNGLSDSPPRDHNHKKTNVSDPNNNMAKAHYSSASQSKLAYLKYVKS